MADQIQAATGIPTWQERLPADAGLSYSYAHVAAMKAEIADLRAQLARLETDKTRLSRELGLAEDGARHWKSKYDAQLARQGQGDPIYQAAVTFPGSTDIRHWYDTSEAVFNDHKPEFRRAFFLAAPASAQPADDRQHMSHADMLALCAANPAAASGLPMSAQPDRGAAQAGSTESNEAFEAWANRHGGLPLDLVGESLETDDGLALPTYRFGRTEIAWRAWAAGHAALGAPHSQPVRAVPDEKRVDDIVTGLYRRFKDWSKRGFGPDDVTWREVKADVLALIATLPQGSQVGGQSDVAALQAENERMRALLNSPELHDFAKGVVLEATHQRERWSTDHDAGKAPADWFWLIGYLGGKALKAHIDGNTEKALHHTISTAAALANWHAAIIGKTTMRPGIEPPPEQPLSTAPEGADGMGGAA